MGEYSLLVHLMNSTLSERELFQCCTRVGGGYPKGVKQIDGQARIWSITTNQPVQQYL